MSKIKLTGSNSGYVEISSAADAGNLTLNLPTSGTALLSNGDNVYTGITTFSNDLKLEGGSYDVLWDSSDNQLEFGDNAKLSFGASSDLQLYHNGNHSYIHDTGTGTLRIQSSQMNVIKADGSETMAIFVADAEVGLFFNNSKKIETTNTGAVVTGICTATSFSGSGEGLTRTTQYSHRNILHNGEYQINQKGLLPKDMNSSTDNDVILDRWYFSQNNNLGDYRISLETDAPAGFKKSIKIQSTSVDTSSAGSEQAFMQQVVEAQNVSHIFNGSGSQPMTLSFYYKSAQTTTRQLWFYTPDTTRMYSAVFTPSAINTWEKFTIPIPADTSNTINDDNGAGFYVRFMIGSGTVYKSGRPTSWQNLSNNRYSGVTNLGTSTANNFYVTGVQLEMGSVDTPFEHRTFKDELSRCQRYFVKTDFSSHVTAYFGGTHLFRQLPFHCPTPMRAQPTFSLSGQESGTTKFTLKTWSSDQNMTATPNAIHMYHTDYVHGTNNSAVHSLGLGIDFASSNSGVPPNGPGNHNVYSCRVYGAQFDAEL